MANVRVQDGDDESLLTSTNSNRPLSMNSLRPNTCDGALQCDQNHDAIGSHCGGCLHNENEPLTFEHTLMLGRFSRELGDYAKDEARRIKNEEQQKLEEQRQRDKRASCNSAEATSIFDYIQFYLWQYFFRFLATDWFLLAFTGLTMACLSFLVDNGITYGYKLRLWFYYDLDLHPLIRYFMWISLALCMVLFAVGFVHIVAPPSVGSGIPEMTVILRGVVLKKYLTFRTLVAKIVGLTATLASGMPLGKEGPFVHMAAIVAKLLSKFVNTAKGVYENEAHNIEILQAACAVGVAACFASPLGGVLFSVEVTSAYFSLRNYWRGFFGAVCGAAIYYLLSYYFHDYDRLKAPFITNFFTDFAFSLQELIAFAMVGVVCGLLGAGFVYLYRNYVAYMRRSEKLNAILQKNRFIYPAVLTLIVATLQYPALTGKYIASELDIHDTLSELFSNFTWSNSNFTSDEQMEIASHWHTESTNYITNLGFYVAFNFIFTAITSTIAVPYGSFIPGFKIGAGVGRFIGECMHVWFPQGMKYGSNFSPIIPGGYAIVGAAAYTAGLTHSISVAVMLFEMTGQITHLVPVMIAVLVANTLAQYLQPSIYEVIIKVKKLPFLPDLLPKGRGMYDVYVKDLMIRDVAFIWRGMSFKELRDVLRHNKEVTSFPLVVSNESMILIGSIKRHELLRLLHMQLGHRLRAIQESARLGRSRFRRPSLSTPDLHTLQNSGLGNNIDKWKKSNSTSAPKRNTFKSIEALFKKSDSLRERDLESGFLSNDDDEMDRFDDEMLHRAMSSAGAFKRANGNSSVSLDDRRRWEREELSRPVDFDESLFVVDQSPFQLVERTSIIKVHTLFSMLNISHAYVTKTGRLVGMVGLTELCEAVEAINNNTFKPRQIPSSEATTETEDEPLITQRRRSHEQSGNNKNFTKKRNEETSMDSALSNEHSS